VRVGVAEDPAGPTGCTLVDFGGDAVRVARDARGGSVCWSGDYSRVHALCLAGGSVYGLEAVSGVAAELLARRGGRAHWSDLALVSGGAIYDFHGRDTDVHPTLALGRAALRAAWGRGAAGDGQVPVGRRGAGISAQVGAGLPGLAPEPGGQGAATRQVAGIPIGVLTVVNAFGAVRDRAGAVVRGHRDPTTGRRHTAAERAEEILSSPTDTGAGRAARAGNTTLTVVVVDARLSDGGLAQLGRQVHSSMARAIDPFHTPFDGDVLWAVTTDRGADDVDPVALGVVAAELAWDAVLAAVR